MGITFTRQEIERTLVELMRQRAVALGYLPDINPFLPSDKAGYKAARAAQVLAGNEIIDILGVGSLEARGHKTFHRVFLNLRQYNNGITHHWSESGYVDTSGGAGTQFERQQVFGSTRTIIYDVRSVCGGENATTYDRICTDVIMGALTTSATGLGIAAMDANFIPDPTRRFLLRYTGSNEIKTTKFFERLYTFEVFDVWLDGDVSSWDVTVPTQNIVPLTRVISEGGADGDPPQTIIDVEP